MISSRSPANFQLLSAGPDGVFGTPDDTQVALTPAYSYPQNYITLQFTNGVLHDGLYRVTVKGVYDVSGNLMQGNGGGSAADQYVDTFTIDRSHNIPPVAANGTAATAENVPVTLTLSSTDPNGEPLTFSIVGAPQHGTLSAINQTNDTVVYTPTTYFNGTDTFTFQVDDSKHGISDATETVTVAPVNQRTIAHGATAATTGNTPATVMLPASDIETAYQNLTFTLGTAPQHGSISQGADGLWTYTPNQYFFGADSFTYTVTDRGNPDGVFTNALTSLPGTVALDATARIGIGPPPRIVDHLVNSGSRQPVG